MTGVSGYFAPVPHDQESIVAQVAREVEDEWFVPLLALRRVRSCLRAGTCDCDDW